MTGRYPPDWNVPAFTAAEFHPRANRYCVAVFVLNEGERIRRQLGKMAPVADRADILIADGGSTDGALEPGFLRAQRVRGVLTKTGAGGLSAQMRMAFAYALAEGYEGVVTIDGNDKDDPAAIPAFLAALAEGADHLQGSRFMAGGVEQNTPWSRRWAVKLLHAPLISLAAGHRYTDTTNGFRAYSARLLRDPRISPFREIFSAYELHYYLAIRAARLGFQCRELPVARRYPATGKTPTKISPLKGNGKIFLTLLKACLHRYDPPETSRG